MQDTQKTNDECKILKTNGIVDLRYQLHQCASDTNYTNVCLRYTNYTNQSPSLTDSPAFPLTA